MKYFLLFFFSLLLISCKNEAKKNFKQYHDKSIEFLSLYQGSDIDQAEKGIRGVISLTEYYKSHNLINGFKYDSIISLSYTRLYLIQKKKGLTNDADNSLEKGVQYFIKGKTCDSAQILKYKEDMINLVNKLDDEAVKPKWKINDAKSDATSIQSTPKETPASPTSTTEDKTK